MWMLKYRSALLLVLPLLLMSALSVIAVDDNTLAPLADDLGAPVTSLEQGVGLFITTIQWMYTLIFIFAVVFILLAAYTFVTSSGDEKKVEKAKKQIWYAVIAVAVALLSVSFTVLIQNFLFDGGGGGANPGNTCDTNPNLPGCAL